MKQRFSYCPWCGGSLTYRRQQDRLRLTCTACHKIFYENPVVGVAGILFDDDGKILLGRRARTSTYPGLWCIPCGYVEYDEEVRAALKREFQEETGLLVQPKQVFTALSNFHNPQLHTVGIWFEVERTGGELAAGDDVDDVNYFSLNDIPPLAFPTDSTVIQQLQRNARKIGRAERKGE